MQVQQMWTAQECAEHWGVQLKTWHSYVARGQAPPHARRIGRTPLWDPAAVQSWPRPGRGRPRTTEDTMQPTLYGNWTTYRIHHSDGPEEYLDSQLPQGRRDGDFDLDAILGDYVAAIEAALPEGVIARGRGFWGPSDPAPGAWDGYPTTPGGDLDIKTIVESIDVAPIIRLWDLVRGGTVEIAVRNEAGHWVVIDTETAATIDTYARTAVTSRWHNVPPGTTARIRFLAGYPPHYDEVLAEKLVKAV